MSWWKNLLKKKNMIEPSLREDLTQLRIYYDNQLDLFEHPGFKDFIEDLMKLKKDNIRTIKDEKEMWYRQGQLDILDFIERKEEQTKGAYETLFTN